MFNLAKKIASKSEHKQHHHAVILTIGGAIVAMGTNKRFRHAESVALGKLLGAEGYKGARSNVTLWSFRWRKNGSFGNAKPCEKCSELLVRFNIRKVWYTDETGKLVRL